MELCDEYLQQLLIIDPTIHDFLSTTTYPKHIQPNVYSESYYEKTHKLDQEFLKRINKQPKQTRYDKLLKHNIEYSIHLEDDYEIYMYIPVDLYHNKLPDPSGEDILNIHKEIEELKKKMDNLKP